MNFKVVVVRFSLERSVKLDRFFAYPHAVCSWVIRDQSLLRKEVNSVLNFRDVFPGIHSEVSGIKFAYALVKAITDCEYERMEAETFPIEDPEVLRIVEVHGLNDHWNGIPTAIGVNIYAVGFQVPAHHVCAEIHTKERS